MELNELIEAVQAATTKDGLEALVRDELGIDVDKRKRLSDIRAEVLQGLGVEQGSESADDGDGQSGEGKPDSAAPVAEAVARSSLDWQLVGDDTIQPPPPEVEPPKTAIPEAKNRLLRNKSTGRTFIWTKELAKLSVMEEI